MHPKNRLYNKHINRNKLHKKHLHEFLEWVKNQGYIVHPKSSPKAIYEVGRIELSSKEGNNPHLVFYARQAPTEHITVPYGASHLVSKFYQERKQNKTEEQNNVSNIHEET